MERHGQVCCREQYGQPEPAGQLTQVVSESIVDSSGCDLSLTADPGCNARLPPVPSATYAARALPVHHFAAAQCDVGRRQLQQLAVAVCVPLLEQGNKPRVLQGGVASTSSALCSSGTKWRISGTCHEFSASLSGSRPLQLRTVALTCCPGGLISVCLPLGTAWRWTLCAPSTHSADGLPGVDEAWCPGRRG